MFAGYSPYSVDFLSTPSTTKLQENAFAFPENYSNYMMAMGSFNAASNSMTEKMNEKEHNSSIDSYRSANSPVLNGDYHNSSVESFKSPVSDMKLIANSHMYDDTFISPSNARKQACDSFTSPTSSARDHNSSLDSFQSSTTQSPSASGGDEVESPPLRCGSKSVKGKNGQAYNKPAQNYIELISLAILGKPQKKILLHEIYEFFEEKYPYFKYVKSSSWKNSIRHNLSLNECFVKNGRSDNGKGNFWSIHPACVQDFRKGDFRRRQARRRAKRGSFSQVAAQTTDTNVISAQQYEISHQLLSANHISNSYVPMSSLQATTGLPYNSYGVYPSSTQTYPAINRVFESSTSPANASTMYFNNQQNIHQNGQQSFIHTPNSYNSALQTTHSSGHHQQMGSVSPQYNGLISAVADYTNSNSINNTTAPPNVNAAYLSQMGLMSNSRECFGAGGVRGFMKTFL